MFFDSPQQALDSLKLNPVQTVDIDSANFVIDGDEALFTVALYRGEKGIELELSTNLYSWSSEDEAGKEVLNDVFGNAWQRNLTLLSA